MADRALVEEFWTKFAHNEDKYGGKTMRFYDIFKWYVKVYNQIINFFPFLLRVTWLFTDVIIS